MSCALRSSATQAQARCVQRVRQRPAWPTHEANIITRADVEARGNERLKFIAEHGVRIYQPTAAEMNEFRRIGQTSYIEWLKKQVDPVWVDMALKDAAWANKEVSE